LQGFRLLARLLPLELDPKAPERPVQRDLDRVRPELEQLPDLPGGEIGAVTERDELAVAFVEPAERAGKVEPKRRVPFGHRQLWRVLDELQPAGEQVLDGASGDSDEPSRRRAPARVVARAVTERALERIRGRVLGVRAVAEPVSAVGVDPPDQRLGVGKRVAVEDQCPTSRSAATVTPAASAFGNSRRAAVRAIVTSARPETSGTSPIETSDNWAAIEGVSFFSLQLTRKPSIVRPTGDEPSFVVPCDHLKMEHPVLDGEAGRTYAQAMRQERLLRALAPVPLVDLRTVHDGLKAGILADLSDLIDSNSFTNGPHVAAFERAFAEYCGARRCVGVASGLDALRLALLSAGLKQGDEVLVPANTFVATLEAVVQAGGIPVLVDVTERDYNIDVEAAAAAIAPRTRVILPVHLYGQLADMQPLGLLAARHGLQVVSDACQAHGATRGGFGAAGGSRAAAFSFFPGKNLGAMGDAGALVTDDDELADRARALREHGQIAKYVHEESGYTARLDTVQALVLLHKLPQLDRWNEQRRAAATYYDTALEGVGDLRLPPVPPGSNPAWHLYVVRTDEPDRLARFLTHRGVSTGRHYPYPAHLLPAWRSLGYGPGAFPVTEALADSVLSLPLFPGIGERQLQTVVDGIADFFRHG